MLSVVLIGVENHASMKLRENLMSALKHISVPFKLETISDWEEIIKSNVTKIPAIKVNDKVGFEGVVPEVNQLEDFINNNIESTENTQIMIKRILFPTDLSKVSENAFQYAAEFAKKTGASITLINAYDLPVSPTGEIVGMVTEEYRQKVLDQMRHMVQRVAPGLTNDTFLLFDMEFGMAAELIINESKEYDLVVMGTTGQHDTLDKLLGTVSLSVSKNAHCPVLLVPPTARWRDGFEKILFASNLDAAAIKQIKSVKGLANLFNSSIHFVHVKSRLDKDEQIEELIVERIFDDDTTPPPFHIKVMKSDSVIDAIREYADKEDVSLVVMVTKHRNFWQNLVHESMTRKMFFHSDLPLMIFHPED